MHLTKGSISFRSATLRSTGRSKLRRLTSALWGFRRNSRTNTEETDLIPAWSLDTIVQTLNQAFERRYTGKPVCLVGLMFAPPESGLGKSEITQSLDYFHHRSRDNIDFFCAGYRRQGKERQPVVETAVTNDSEPWYFNVMDFESLRKEIQSCSSWKYSGESDLILLNATKGSSGQDVILDWSSAICCDLEKMKKDNAIESARRFFEGICDFADGYEGNNPVWDFSDQQGVITAKSGLAKLILSILPKTLQELYSEGKHHAVRNISRGQKPPYILPDLLRNGDFIVAIEHLLRSTDEELNKYTEASLSEQLENLLSVAEIGKNVPLSDNVWDICAKPIVALRAAVVAVRLARITKQHSPEQELSLNLLRRDILFGVTGIDQELEQHAIERCVRDCEKIAHCLVGALSDVASCSPENSKQDAMEDYSRLCDIVFS